MEFLSLDYVLFSVLDYPISLLECLGIVSGLFCVYYASVDRIITWPIGIFNSICFFFLFYQIHLYSDMLLQIYFFASSIYGWIYWQKRKGIKPPITTLRWKVRYSLVFSILIFSFFLGELTKKLPVLLPVYFTEQPSFPYWDAFTTVASIVANFLLARRIAESWFIWISVDVVCIVLYYLKDIRLVTIEYFVFLVIAVYGSYIWYKESRDKIRTSLKSVRE
ncbi:nicotinamide mononucleotide transporter [Leptospira kobayashii]|uniref:Nicotinamide riboside transporter PnuC n=1 Tax=Leptospira kobayashii TaxID=1917830 RepID=A0ABM7UTS1_9LEPT|nr:nicotinamide riboside transporter PnuC [Leptospira kobayashii]BDA80702.1 nicotinamide mononucleotide transporter [Leptospira kobayashii]